MRVRELTHEEQVHIECAIAEHTGEFEPETREILLDASVAVVRNYMTDGPGWTGDIYLIIWPAEPDLVNIVYHSLKAKDAHIYDEWFCAIGTDEIRMR